MDTMHTSLETNLLFLSQKNVDLQNCTLLPYKDQNTWNKKSTIQIEIDDQPIVQHTKQHLEPRIFLEPQASITSVSNPYEIARSPHKKKKQDRCFENKALNLEAPDPQCNPFEVMRVKSPCSNFFINNAFNLMDDDKPATPNPFEISRHNLNSVLTTKIEGIANFGLDTNSLQRVKPSKLQIMLPFTPTIDCRIDFKGLPLDEIAPNKLWVDKKIISNKLEQKRSLGIINEEPTVDIGIELDSYQLELENSINEAKIVKLTDKTEKFVQTQKKEHKNTYNTINEEKDEKELKYFNQNKIVKMLSKKEANFWENDEAMLKFMQKTKKKNTKVSKPQHWLKNKVFNSIHRSFKHKPCNNSKKQITKQDN